MQINPVQAGDVRPWLESRQRRAGHGQVTNNANPSQKNSLSIYDQNILSSVAEPVGLRFAADPTSGSNAGSFLLYSKPKS